ncbi:ceramide phosphoethanolamine synthase [Fopius arisanus]|uniref:Ceramide phosphoethanolamine synthase n=1 Tax=Fopius arisanus TaxID=64838 RepID=A0A9R1T4W5_9HYME|nr:PREDICTED: ceramide phosphoethanolamine synthase [Fopius arisanus]
MGFAHSDKRQWIIAVIIYILFCGVMDLRLHYRMRNYGVRVINNNNGSETNYLSDIIPCDLDPLCVVTIKGLTLDYINFYILGPLAGLTEKLMRLSESTWISPNLISITHVFVAVCAGQLISRKSLMHRRFGVLAFQIRSWLDDLDGFVARKIHHVYGEHSDVGSTGYFVDAICDTLGTAALLIGIFIYLKNNMPKYSGYMKLEPIVPVAGSQIGSCVVQKKKIRHIRVIPTILLITGELIISSALWNRYIDLYQNLLESDNLNLSMTQQELFNKQSEVLRQNSLLITTTLWRLINPHALTDYILAAIFIDRLWSYMHSIRWIGYIFIFVVVYYTEFQYMQSSRYIMDVGALVVSEINANSTVS